jgi:hypothetical protein
MLEAETKMGKEYAEGDTGEVRAEGKFKAAQC